VGLSNRTEIVIDCVFAVIGIAITAFALTALPTETLRPIDGILVGLLITVFLGHAVRPIRERIGAEYGPLTAPDKRLEKVWKEVSESRPGGKWIGAFERLMFFGSIWLNLWPIVVGWLAFKVAAYWSGAGKINALPQWLVDHPEWPYFSARLAWATRVVIFLLVGTGANIAIALLGVGVGKWLISDGLILE